MALSDLLPPIAEEKAACPTHGEYTARFVVLGSGERRGGRCPECMAEEKRAEERERDERRERLASEERQRALDAAGVPPRFSSCTFDTFVAESPEQMRALKLCRDLVDRVHKSPRRAPCLIFAGKPGNGKTHLSCAIVRALAGRTVVRRNLADVIDEVRATWAKGATETRLEVVERYANYDLLIVDEVGGGYGTDAERAEIFRIIDRRYERELPVVLITNLTVEELGKEIGERVIDRMRQDGGQLLTFTGESRRRTAQ